MTSGTGFAAEVSNEQAHKQESEEVRKTGSGVAPATLR